MLSIWRKSIRQIDKFNRSSKNERVFLKLKILMVNIYSILVHGHDLLLSDEEGTICRGGVYSWRTVRAQNEEEATELAKISLLGDEGLLNEIWNKSDSPISVSVEEVHLRNDPIMDDNPESLVFYVEDLPGTVEEL